MAIFQQGELLTVEYFSASDYEGAKAYISSQTIDAAILSTTQQDNVEFSNWLHQFTSTIDFTANTPIPLSITYTTPDTLGDDRKAAIVGAMKFSPNTPLLVITAGTCITYNYFDGVSFIGGSITPGIEMRYQSMHDYTGLLPRAEHQPLDHLVGKSTLESLQTGVQWGVIFEVDGFISEYRLLQENLEVYLCGGDTNFFDSRLKSKIFAHPNLILHGLNNILEYNKTE